MINKEQDNRYQYEMMCIDEMVPKNHLLRKIEKAVDFKKIYEITDELYCADNGRPNVDAVVLFKMVLIQHLFGIASLRRTHAEIEVNIAYRWFLGYSLSDKIPHFSTVSHNFKHRYSIEVIDKVFEWILREIANKGYLSPETLFIDGTHIKANANIKKAVKKQFPKHQKYTKKN
jgi:transposase